MPAGQLPMFNSDTTRGTASVRRSAPAAADRARNRRLTPLKYGPRAVTELAPRAPPPMVLRRIRRPPGPRQARARRWRTLERARPETADGRARPPPKSPRLPQARPDLVRRADRPYRLFPRRIRRAARLALRARLRRSRRAGAVPARPGVEPGRLRHRPDARRRLGGLAAWAGFTLPSAALMLAFAYGAAGIADLWWAPACCTG